ncbi:hypothetical protein [Piscinibacter gummiphilus]|uniref:Apea-like HEPN domain-containing protein n=1 Tax=Piscinibacter gummiphilus TaxID=946333 RepID=A0ABZ0CVK2_9BURK|nr:hypothetical protein [Piscinibacter gummiphilus]WOB06898.1 hypothetical protein RXV79_18470 [Piscinibacter gummiphilus]
MKALELPEALAQEFATVVAVWSSGGTTRRVDALLLSWVKYEKQLRRLFCFLVYQHPKISEQQVEGLVAVLVENRNLKPETFVKAIDALKVDSVATIVGEHYTRLQKEVRRIKQYRNKLMHGQISGQRITSRQIEQDVKILIEWVAALAAGSQARFGYDGIGRNTYRAAKAKADIAVTDYPFTNVAEFKAWLQGITA